VKGIADFSLGRRALLGAAAGGSLGHVAAGLTRATVGVGVGALAGLGVGAAASKLTRPAYGHPVSYPYYGCYCCPVFYVGPPAY